MAAALTSRKNYEAVFSRLDRSKFSVIGAAVADLVEEYYEKDTAAAAADPTVLVGRVEAKFVNPKQASVIQEYVSSLDISLSVPNLTHDIRLFRQQEIGSRLAMCLANKEDPKEITELMTEYQDLGHGDDESTEEAVYKSYKVENLVVKAFAQDNLIKLLPKELNDRCDGGARPGHHVLVYARPEIGKTLFVINLTAGFLMQDLPVLYCGNEDPASDILIRMVCRLSKMTKQNVLNNPTKAEEVSRTRGYDNLIVASLSPGNFFEIRKLVDKFKPKIVILDQLRNLEVNSESRVQALEKAATEARNLAKKYELLVVSVTQAGESAEGKAILGRDDIDFSKTGIPAQVDLMIGIGADETMEKHGIRTISLPKNKLSGNHAHFTVTINPQIGTVESA